MFKHILMVCTGNICRSPTAEAVLRTRLGDKARSRRVASLGTMGVVGEPAFPMSFEVALEYGIDLSAHRARQATGPLLSQADLILALDRSHEHWMLARHPELKGRVHLLGRWSGQAEVADPYGFPREAHVKAFEEIEKYVEDWIPRIVG